MDQVSWGIKGRIEARTSMKAGASRPNVDGFVPPSQQTQPMARSRNEINNEVLGRLWNDPSVRMLNRDVDSVLPEHISEGEIVVDYEHLLDAGYAGKPPEFHLRVGKFLIYRQVAFYRDYWLRFKMPRQGRSNLYSIFKRRK